MERTNVSIVLQRAAAVITARKATDCKGEMPPISIPHNREGMKTSPTNSSCERAGAKARVMDFVRMGRKASN